MDRSLELFAARSSLCWAAEQGFMRQRLRAQLARGWRRPALQASLPSKDAWRAGGLQTASVEAMRPHPGRTASFDERLRPLQSSLRHRWVTLYLIGEDALQSPVQILKVDAGYYVLDGHVRISVACAMGRLYMNAQVWEADPTPARNALQPRAHAQHFRLVEQLWDAWA